MVEISLHGATAATHDRQTRVPGSFGRLLANLERMRALGLRVQLNATMTSWNEAEMGPMSALAEGLGMALRWNTQITPRMTATVATRHRRFGPGGWPPRGALEAAARHGSQRMPTRRSPGASIAARARPDSRSTPGATSIPVWSGASRPGTCIGSG